MFCFSFPPPPPQGPSILTFKNEVILSEFYLPILLSSKDPHCKSDQILLNKNKSERKPNPLSQTTLIEKQIQIVFCLIEWAIVTVHIAYKLSYWGHTPFVVELKKNRVIALSEYSPYFCKQSICLFSKSIFHAFEPMHKTKNIF